MTKLLYIKASPKDAKCSNSITVAEAFLKEYKEVNKNAEVIIIDLYKDHPILIDNEILNVWCEIDKGADISEIPFEKRSKVELVEIIANEFISADDYLIASPLWGLNINTLLKAYLDCVLMPGKTFTHDENGNIKGILKNKKAIYIQSSGGIYDRSNPLNVDYASRYMKTIFNFMGVTDFNLINMDGMDLEMTDKEVVRANAIREAKKFAKRFANLEIEV